MDKVKEWAYEQNLHSKTEWWRYFGEYSLTTDLVLKKSEQSEVTVLTLPTLFLMRHTLELAFKANLIEIEKVSGEQANFKLQGGSAHVLQPLHAEFTIQVKLVFQKEKVSLSSKRF